MLKRHNIKFVKGDTFNMGLTIRDSQTGEPLDLSDSEFVGRVISGGQVLLTFNIDKADADLGHIVINLTDEQTATLKGNEFRFGGAANQAGPAYYWNLKRVYNGETYTLLDGSLTVIAETP